MIALDPNDNIDALKQRIRNDIAKVREELGMTPVERPKTIQFSEINAGNLNDSMKAAGIPRRSRRAYEAAQRGAKSNRGALRPKSRAELVERLRKPAAT